jgi:valyl-tRNA synthetase
MSKTKGNVLDPTALVEEFGADALRFTLITQATPGNDSRLSRDRIEDSRNFANKLWNATRFALRPIGESTVQVDENGPVRPTEGLALADRWILSRLDAVTEEANRLFESYLFGEAGRQIREFIWSELCDWYIEAAKVRLRGTDAERDAVAQTTAHVLERSLRLLHPFMPFITEALWHELPHAGESVMIARWPSAQARDLDAEDRFGLLIELVSGIRNARSESGVEPARWIAARFDAGAHEALIDEARAELSLLARIADDQLTISADPSGGDQALTVVARDVVAYLPLAGMVDLDAERDRLRKEIQAAEAEAGRAQAMLGNESFVARAPEKVVEVQRQRLAAATAQVDILKRRLDELG